MKARIGLVVSLVLVSGGVENWLPASAICAAPQISLDKSSGNPGESVTINGENFADGCGDTATVDVGNPNTQPQPTPPPPLRGIQIVLLQYGHSWELATVDADNTYRFQVTVHVPEGPNGGSSTVRAAHQKIQPIKDDNGWTYPAEETFTVTGVETPSIQTSPATTPTPSEAATVASQPPVESTAGARAPTANGSPTDRSVQAAGSAGRLSLASVRRSPAVAVIVVLAVVMLALGATAAWRRRRTG